MDAELGLKATLNALRLPPAQQIKLFQDPEGSCLNCRFSMLYDNWLEILQGRKYLRRLTRDQKAALKRVEAGSQEACKAPCYENEHLAKSAAFKQLRKLAAEALESLGWEPERPDKKYVIGTSEYARVKTAELEAERAARLKARPAKMPVANFDDISRFDPTPLKLDAFRNLLKDVPWFENIGKPHALDAQVERIKSWKEWTGPESAQGEVFNAESNQWLAGIDERHPGQTERLEKLQWEFRRECWRAIATRFHEPADGDPWDPVTNAVNRAAWFVGLIACWIELGEPIPKNALRQWAWYCRGHWPCLYSRDDQIKVTADGVSEKELENAWLVVF